MTEEKYKKRLIIWIVITVILVGAAYYAGIKHETSKLKSSFGRGASGLTGARTGAAGGRFAGGTGGLVTGTVLSKDDTSITVQSRDGSSKIVLYSPSTQVLESTAGTITSVADGSQVSAQGTQNTDGSVTASSIQIRPAAPAGSSTGAAGTSAQAPMIPAGSSAQ